MRITPEQVVEAYKATGLKPKRGEYFSIDGCACGMGAVYYSEMKLEEDTIVVNWYFDERFGSNYRCGFAWGFDGEDPHPGSVDMVEATGLGYADGQAAWKAVVDAGLVEAEALMHKFYVGETVRIAHTADNAVGCTGRITWVGDATCEVVLDTPNGGFGGAFFKEDLIPAEAGEHA